MVDAQGFEALSRSEIVMYGRNRRKGGENLRYLKLGRVCAER
jgi:hypothetical protein